MPAGKIEKSNIIQSHLIKIPEASRITEITLGCLFLLAGLFLTLASYQVMPLGMNKMWVKVVGFSFLSIGLLIFLISRLSTYFDSIHTNQLLEFDEDILRKIDTCKQEILKLEGQLKEFYTFVEKNPQLAATCQEFYQQKKAYMVQVRTVEDYKGENITEQLTNLRLKAHALKTHIEEIGVFIERNPEVKKAFETTFKKVDASKHLEI